MEMLTGLNQLELDKTGLNCNFKARRISHVLLGKLLTIQVKYNRSDFCQ